MGDDTCRFSSLYREYDNVMCKLRNEGLESLKLSIETNNFPSFLIELQGLNLNLASDAQQSKKALQVKCALSAKLRELLYAVETKARRLGLDLSPLALQEIMDHWNTLRAAKCVIQYADVNTRELYSILTSDPPATYVSIQDERMGTPPLNNVESIMHIVQMKLKALAKQMQVAMKSGQFVKADDLMTRLQRASATLGALIGDEVWNVINNYDSNQKAMIHNQIRQLEEMEVDEYQVNPPRDFFAIFESQGSGGSNTDALCIYDKYKTELHGLKNTLESKVQQRIVETDLYSGSCENLSIDRILRTLPIDLQKVLEAFRSEKKQKSDSDMKELNHHFQDSLDNLDVRAVAAVFSRKSILIPTFEKELENRLRIFHKRIVDSLESGSRNLGVDLGDVHFARECCFFHGIQQSVPAAFRIRVCNAIGDIHKKLETAFVSACTNLRFQLVNHIPKRLDDGLGYQEFLAAYTFIHQLIVLNHNVADNSDLKHDLLPSDLEKRFQGIVQDLVADYRDKVIRISRALSPEPLETQFDLQTAANIANQLKQRESIYSNAVLQFNGGSCWTSSDSDCRSTIYANEDADFHDARNQIIKFVHENFKASQEIPTELKSKVHCQTNREKWFGLLGKRILALPTLKYLMPFFDGEDLVAVGDAFKENVRTNMIQTWDELQEILSDDSKVNSSFEKIHALYSNLELFKTQVESRVPAMCLGNNLDEVVLKLSERVRRMASRAAASKIDNLDEITTVLLDIKRQSEGILFMRKESEQVMSDFLTEVQRSKGIQGQRLIAKLAVKLRQCGAVGQRIVSELEIFRGYESWVFNAKTRCQDIDYVLKNLKGSDDLSDHSKRELFLNYAAFLAEYEGLRDTYVGKKEAVSHIAQLIHNKVNSIEIDHSSGLNWTRDMSYAVPVLVARIFAMWTIHHSKRFLDALDPQDRLSYLLQPHPAQVIAVFRLFGLDAFVNSDVSVPDRHMVQIETGQGKTAVLAIAACIFGLFGIEVSCVCYSEYLSGRDSESVKFLFEALGIGALITYKTLIKLCEDEINIRVNVRAMVEEMIIASSTTTDSEGMRDGSLDSQGGLATDAFQKNKHFRNAQHPRVLLIDEVDTFFTKDFYGNMYTPSCHFRHHCISDIIKKIWHEFLDAKNMSFEDVKTWEAYRLFCELFQGWEFLLESAVSRMLVDLTVFHSHEYVCFNDKIGYKEQDGITFDASFGYQTVFAYLQEHERGNVSLDSLERNLAMLIDCGQFLFAKIPNNFTLLMGVTGTLKSLTASQKSIIQAEYNVQKFTYMPSVYGPNKLLFRTIADVKIEHTDFFFIELAAEIDKHIPNRAVLVFFESSERLQQFFKSQVFTHRSHCNVLLEETSAILKSDIIRCRAAAANSVTLLTKSFGRGTDFVCFDEGVNTHGGVHVIQTFLSETLSEEIQIRGRTARQGEPGSYSQVLDAQDLEKFLITDEEIAAHKASGTWYEMLCTKREVFFTQQYGNISRFVDDNVKKHDEAISFVDSLTQGDKMQVQAFLRSENPTMKLLKDKTRILVLMDATVSMSNLMLQVKNSVSTMFDRAQKILEEHVSGGSLADVFEMQIAVYRNYNSSANHLLEHSSWECQPRNLRRFLDLVETEGGWGREAVEIGLWYARQESSLDKHQKLSQVILIGDASANSEEEVLAKRKDKGEDYWANTCFKERTYYKRELENLAASKVPVHTFHIDLRAASNFQEIALATNGTNCFLDIDSDSETLTHHITEAILSSVGGSEKGGVLVDAYRARFTYRGSATP